MRALFLILALIVALPVASVQPASAQDLNAIMADKPLLVIRFNQRTVYYSKALYTAVSRAVETKPDVIFALTALVPQTGNKENDQAYTSLANQHTRQVLQELQSIGVPPSRVQVKREFSPNIDYDEVHLRAF